MADKQIPYITRDYAGCRSAIREMMMKYYPDVFASLNDASIGQWLVDMTADVYDSLNFHIDRLYQETTLSGAQKVSSLQNIARTNGLRIPGRKSAICEVELSCVVPTSTDSGSFEDFDRDYCPIVKKGTLFSTGMVTFELTEDVNFAEQFNSEGVSDRQVIPNRDSNGNITGYTLRKLAIASAGQSKIYKKVITANDLTPFMSITLQDSGILGVESIIVKKGTSLVNDPDITEFMVDDESYLGRDGKTPITRFFEVDNLAQQYRFGDEIPKGVVKGKTYYQPIWSPDNNNDVPKRIAKGVWKRLKHKFITEYTDQWYLKVIFGAGIENQNGDVSTTAETGATETGYKMSKMIANDAMGVLPENGATLYILYRVGGGEISNIAVGSLTNIIFLNMETNCNSDPTKARQVRNSITVTNTTPSYGGKDEPSEEEIKYLIKYNNSAQRRCVTLKDYYSRITEMPAKYGQPFRIGVIEENNKVVVYTLGLNPDATLTTVLAQQVADNIKEYLSMYRNVTDFVEIRSGKVINIKFQITVYVDKMYEKSEVVKEIIDTVYDYMDIRKHLMGEDIYLGDLQRAVSHINGVQNLVNLKCYNMVGNGYSEDEISQELVDSADCCEEEWNDVAERESGQHEINLRHSDYILFSDANSMFEIKDKNSDIVVVVKTR